MIDWPKAFRHGAAIHGDYHQSGTEVTDAGIMWALLCEAARVSRSYPGPPRTGYPAKSTLPDAPDEVTYWQKLAAYVRGDVDEAPETDATPPRPSAEEISRADAILHVWHHSVTLGRDRKRAVYLRACGSRSGLIARVTGLTRHDQRNAKTRATREMVEAVGKYL